jgi:hypothetical protein
VVGVDVLTKTTGLFLFCWLYRKPGDGNAQAGVGDGLGVGVGVAVGVGVGVADGFGVGVGVGVAVGVGVGVGVAIAAVSGTLIQSAAAVEVKARLGPPKKTHRTGVMIVKWPVTETTARLPYVGLQFGVHTIETSAAETLAADPLASLITAHMTVLELEHASPATHVAFSSVDHS